MKICFTGDAIMLTNPSDDYWNNNYLVKIIKECDVRGSNLEMVLSGDKAFASTFCGGQWLTTTSEKLDILGEFGFDYYNTANNHTMDYSYSGLRMTNDALDQRGILHSGSGDSLANASKPVYLERNGKKIAFVSCTASCDDAARAGDPSLNIPPRPGVNMLRHSERLIVTKDIMDIIDSTAETLCVNARFLKSVKMGTHLLNSDIHRFGRLEFVLGDELKKMTYCHKGDLERILLSIDSAKKERADLIVVNIHSHDIKGMSDDTADYYHEEFARACIDNGASVVIGTGTHQLKGIEIYKGCPIFYSLGNFMFKEELMEYAPHDIFERYHVDDNLTPEELYNVRTKGGTVGLVFDPYNFRSVIPILEYGNDNSLIGVQLVPIELGFDDDNKEKGFPYLAEEDIQQEIFDRLNRLSTEYGTEMSIKNGVIEIMLLS